MAIRELFKNSLESGISKIIDSKLVKEIIEGKLSSNSCDRIAWNRLLSSIGNEEKVSIDRGYLFYKYIFEDDEIEQLANFNCDIYFRNFRPLPPIHQITRDGSDVNLFVKNAKVPYGNNNNNTSNKKIGFKKSFKSL